MSRLKLIALAAFTVCAVIALGAGASARSGDRNHDRIPDRWERHHHLSLHVNQARRDQDRDGLNNRGEFKSGTNPRDRDSDDDGTRDGDDCRPAVTAAASSHGSDDSGSDNSGPGSTSSGRSDDPATHDATDDHGTDDPATHDAGDDHGTDDPATHDAGDDHGSDDPATHDAGDDDCDD